MRGRTVLAWRHALVGTGAVALSLLCGVPVQAQDAAAGVPAATTPRASDANLQTWLQRLHEAPRRRSYVGTFVVSSGSDMLTSKIWHVCDGSQQFERIESLTGAPRTTIRRNDEVVTFLPTNRIVVQETRENLRLFPDLLLDPQLPVGDYYSAVSRGVDRVAGFDAQVVDFVPRDQQRYGYRIWTEKRTGLVIKLQTRDPQGEVLEQVAFTELQLDAPVQMEALSRQMRATKGYQLVRPVMRKTTPEAEGWRLKQPVAGFQSMSCLSTAHSASPDAPSAVQWVFSDGLASVSLFMETFDPQRHTKEKASTAGATQALSRRLGDYWVTAMGEVPLETLGLFVQALERTR